LIDLVGYLGSRFSYATHTAEVARALHREKLLGRIYNLDPHHLEDYADEEWFAASAVHGPSSGSALIIAPPREEIDAFAKCYGEERAALFLCPNTNRIDGKKVAGAFKRFVVPSLYCVRTVRETFPDAEVLLAPLGCPDDYYEKRQRTIGALRSRLDNRPVCMHFTTDFFLPGRKGTEELILGWADCNLSERADLVIHCPFQMVDQLFYLCADAGLYEPHVRVVSAQSPQGSTAGGLGQLMLNSDLVVQPSRAEGFGMMILGALVHGVPVVTPCATGQEGFLPFFTAWQPIPTAGEGPLHGELGDAPILVPYDIGRAIHAALDSRSRLLDRAEDDGYVARRWTWSAVLERWIEVARTIGGTNAQ